MTFIPSDESGIVARKIGGDNMTSHFVEFRSALCVMTCLTGSLLIGCSGKEPPQERAVPSATQEKPNSAEVTLPAPFGLYIDDLDGIVKRRNIRALVMINPIGFFYDNGQPMGVNYEALEAFELFVNEKLKTGVLRVKVTFIPVRPDQVEAALTQGVGDVVAYALVVTPDRQQRVAFTVPVEKDLKQVIVTGPNFGTVSSLQDLGGKQIYVNPLTVTYRRLKQVSHSS
jgi:ABC-type amino acid transport substrate-binding protein